MILNGFEINTFIYRMDLVASIPGEKSAHEFMQDRA